MQAELPPSVAFMLDEFRGNHLALQQVRRRLSDKVFVRDYFDQCSASIRTYKYADDLDARFDKFDVYAGTGLDPLSFHGKCEELQCVKDSARHFARTACLYGDRVVIADPFSFGFESTDQEIFLFLVVLKELRPLLEAGIVVFGPGAYVACGSCSQAMKAAEKEVANQLWQEFTRSAPDVFRYKEGRRWLISFGSPLFTRDGIGYRIAFPAKKEAVIATKPNTLLSGKSAMAVVRQYSRALKEHFSGSAHSAAFNSQMGSRCNTTLITNSPEEALGYRLLDRRKVGFTVPNWSMLRTVPLPALQNLNTSQALQVREEAEKAMPAFRAKLQRDLMSLKNLSDEEEEQRAVEVAAELRLAARELQGQLAGIKLASVRRSENLFKTLGVALEIIALSSRNPATIIAASGTFIALMLAAHQSHREHQEKQEVLVHQPAYVLLTAERIHAKH